MKIKHKIRLINLTTWTMSITISTIAIWFLGFMITEIFDLKVFASFTSEFISWSIGFSVVLVVCSAILNVSLNIGLIADAQSRHLKNELKTTISKKFYIITLFGILGLVAFLFLGDQLKRQETKNQLLAAADYITSSYSKSIDRISTKIYDTTQVNEIAEILGILSSQKSEYPSVSLIKSDNYDGQLIFQEMTQWSTNLKKRNSLSYKCKEYNCSYLKKIFTGKTTEPLLWTKGKNYEFYMPFNKKRGEFILLFKNNSHYYNSLH